jgi:hypothetical protein
MSTDNTNVLPRVPGRCTTTLSFIIITESATVHTVMGGLTAVVAFVKATENTEETTGFANGATELYIRTDFDGCVIKLSA